VESGFYVYVLCNLADGKFYIGFTSNLKRRKTTTISFRVCNFTYDVN
jgi:predicted GIY-YIG superfamily endonuclease